MFARTGDRVVVQSTRLGGKERHCTILEVRGDGGRPPYVVRWAEDGHEGLFFPGTDAAVETSSRKPRHREEGPRG
jgi:Domain of unknown function (DUF1918)